MSNEGGDFFYPDSPGDAALIRAAHEAEFEGTCFRSERSPNPCTCSCWGCKYHCGGCWRW